jgi:hypothetical protein
MKTKCFILGVALAYTVMCALVGCSKSGNTQSSNTNGMLVLNVKDFPEWNDTLPGGYWDKTYNDSITSITIGEFVFSHLPAGSGSSWGGSYWDGFTTGTNGDNYGEGGPETQPLETARRQIPPAARTQAYSV